MEASLLYRRVINIFKDDPEISLALSMLWKYIITMLDCVMYKKKQEIDKINGTIDKKVVEKVKVAMSAYELEKMTLEQKLAE